MNCEEYHVTHSATDGGHRIYYGDDNRWTGTSWPHKETTKEKVQGSITIDQEKMIKEEIKIWMDDHLQKTIKKEAGKLFKDIENLKEEKKRLGKAISSLKQELKKTKKEINEEIKNMENILDEYNEKTMRFYNMDL